MLSRWYLDLSLWIQFLWGELTLCALSLLWCLCLSVFMFLTVADARGADDFLHLLSDMNTLAYNLLGRIKLVIFWRSEMMRVWGAKRLLSPGGSQAAQGDGAAGVAVAPQCAVTLWLQLPGP